MILCAEFNFCNLTVDSVHEYTDFSQYKCFFSQYESVITVSGKDSELPITEMLFPGSLSILHYLPWEITEQCSAHLNPRLQISFPLTITSIHTSPVFPLRTVKSAFTYKCLCLECSFYKGNLNILFYLNSVMTFSIFSCFNRHCYSYCHFHYLS